ncbi:hypothetical protein JCM11491_004176 [Sporobolomyces phaffii]
MVKQGTKLYLCVDAGGTKVQCVVMNERGEVGTATGGPCNVKSIGPEEALRNIVRTSFAALQHLPGQPLLIPVNKADLHEPLHLELFERVWLGVAGILRDSEISAFRPLAAKALGFDPADDRLRITNDGHLLAAPAVSLRQIVSTVVLVAGTGSVSLAFRKVGTALRLVGLSGGWGFLIGDEGSAFHVGKLAMRRLMFAADATSPSTSALPSPLLPIFSSLLERLGASDPADMIDRIYSDHSPSPSTFSSAETRRKLWIADASRVVFRYAYEDPAVDRESREMAVAILEEAIQPLVDATIHLLGYGLDPKQSSLSLGGGLWNSAGYTELLLRSLGERGVEFAHVATVKSAAEEGAKALLALG